MGRSIIVAAVRTPFGRLVTTLVHVSRRSGSGQGDALLVECT